MLWWTFFAGVTVIACLGVTAVVWVVRSRLRERRRARFVAQLSAHYREARPGKTPPWKVTVDELGGAD